MKQLLMYLMLFYFSTPLFSQCSEGSQLNPNLIDENLSIVYRVYVEEKNSECNVSKSLYDLYSCISSNLLSQSQFNQLINIQKRTKTIALKSKILSNLILNTCHRAEVIKNYQKEARKILLEDGQISNDEIGTIGYYRIYDLKDSVIQWRNKSYRDSTYNKRDFIDDYMFVLAQLGDTFAEKKVIQLVSQTADNPNQKPKFSYLTALNTSEARAALFKYIKLYPLYHKVENGDDYIAETWSLSYYAAREVFFFLCQIPIKKWFYDTFMLEEKDVKIIQDWLEENSEEYRAIIDPVKEEEKRLMEHPKDEREKRIGEQLKKYQEMKKKEAEKNKKP